MTDAPAAVQASSRFDGFEALDGCHAETLRMLEQLATLAAGLGDGGADERARRLATLINEHFSVTMREHHEDEERHVFPPLAATADAATAHAVDCLVQDHAWIETDWRELAPLLDAIANGQSWVDLDALRQGVEVFTALCRDHIALEESVIYPRALAQLERSGHEPMNREMALRRQGRLQQRERG